jgi:hypothetical protein
VPHVLPVKVLVPVDYVPTVLLVHIPALAHHHAHNVLLVIIVLAVRQQ